MNLKQMVGIKAASHVKQDMIVGLGTGSTAYYFIEELGRRVKEEHLQIQGVPTSIASREHASKLGIPIRTIDDVPYVDLVVDGADEISADFQGIKGGGAALLFEKIVASYAKEIIWIVDQSKMVDTLGKFPLPVEVVPYGAKQLFRLFSEKGYNPSFRLTADGQLLTTDCNHNIIDLHLTAIEHPHQLNEELNQLVGVVEHGLFLDMVKTVIVGQDNGPKTILVPPRKIK